MSQPTTWGNPTVGPSAPSAYAAQEKQSFDALLSNHSGSSRPTYAVVGTIWADTSIVGKISYKVYDGAADRLIYTIDTTTGAKTFSGVDPAQVFATKGANYTAVAADNNAYNIFSAASLALSLTAPGTLGANWHYDGYAAGGALTVTPASGLINGVASIAIPQFCNFSIKCDGTNFTCVINPAQGYVDAKPGRNRVINGDMRVNQRAASYSAYGYTLDRWLLNGTGTAPTVTQVTGPAGFKNALRITGVAGNTQTSIQQRIESANIADLAGGACAHQFVLQASSAQTVKWELYYPTALDNFAANTLISSGTWSVTTSPQKFTASASGLPSQVTNGLLLVIYPNNAGAFTSGTLDITGVQLEPGTIPSAFEFIDIGEQQRRCYRYLPSWNWQSGNDLIGYGYSFSSTQTLINIPFPVVPRVIPTGIIASGISNMTIRNGSNVGGPATGISLNVAGSTTQGSVSFNTSAGSPALTGGQGAFAFATAAAQILWTGCEL